MSTATLERRPTSPGGPTPDLGRPRRVGEGIVMAVLFACAAVSVVTTVGIVFILFAEAFQLFREPAITLTGFLFGTDWSPFGGLESASFSLGVLPLVNGTLLVTAIALVVAVPLGLATAVYLSDYARPRVRRWLKPTLEVLAGIPTVVLGYFALTFVTPVLRGVLGVDTVQIFNAASAGIVVGIMIVPTVASLSEDALTAVPRTLREGAFGLGATKRQAVLKVVFPAALSGIVAAIILAMGRAIGETMIVAIAAGNLPTLTADPFSQIQTMTAYIVQAVQGEAPRGSLTYESLFAVGALLFTMTLTLNLLAQAVVRRFRQEY